MATITHEVYRDGALVRTEQVDVPEEYVNRQTIEQRAAHALAANRTFIAKGATNTAGDVRAQTIALSRQVNGVLRLLLNQLDGTD